MGFKEEDLKFFAGHVVFGDGRRFILSQKFFSIVSFKTVGVTFLKVGREGLYSNSSLVSWIAVATFLRFSETVLHLFNVY